MDPASTLAGYESPEEIGRGGFGVVYRVWDAPFRRHVAVKVLTGSLDAEAEARFDRERVALGAIAGHPHILNVFASGRTETGAPYIAMEYMRSGSFEDEVARSGRLDWADVVRIGVKLAGALETAHQAGILHRDVKPANILIDEYHEPQLADFGIAEVLGGTEAIVSANTATLEHASPELLRGEPAGPASDVYALASTLFTLLAGWTPFERPGEESTLPLMRRIAFDPPPDLRAHGVPGEVCTVIETGLNKEPAQRIPSAAAMASMLRGAQTELGMPATDPVIRGQSAPPPALTSAAPPRRSGRRQVVLATAAVAVIALVVTAIFFGTRGRGQAAPTTTTTTGTAPPTTRTPPDSDVLATALLRPEEAGPAWRQSALGNVGLADATFCGVEPRVDLVAHEAVTSIEKDGGEQLYHTVASFEGKDAAAFLDAIRSASASCEQWEEGDPPVKFRASRVPSGIRGGDEVVAFSVEAATATERFNSDYVFLRRGDSVALLAYIYRPEDGRSLNVTAVVALADDRLAQVAS